MGASKVSGNPKKDWMWTNRPLSVARTAVLLLTGLIVFGLSVFVYLCFVTAEGAPFLDFTAYRLPVAENKCDDTVGLTRMIVTVDSPGKLYVFNRPVTVEQFRHLLQMYSSGLRRYQAGQVSPIHIRARKDLTFGAVWGAVAPCRDEGFYNLGFCVVLARSIDKGLLAFRPGAEYKPDSQAIDLVVRRGAYSVNGRSIGGNELRDAVRSAVGAGGSAPVRVVASADATHQEVVRALDAFAGAGRRDVTIFLAGESPSQQPQP